MVRSGQPDLTDYGVRMAVGQLGDHVDFMKYCERNETGAAVTAASLLALSFVAQNPDGDSVSETGENITFSSASSFSSLPDAYFHRMKELITAVSDKRSLYLKQF